MIHQKDDVTKSHLSILTYTRKLVRLRRRNIHAVTEKFEELRDTPHRFLQFPGIHPMPLLPDVDFHKIIFLSEKGFDSIYDAVGDGDAAYRLFVEALANFQAFSAKCSLDDSFISRSRDESYIERIAKNEYLDDTLMFLLKSSIDMAYVAHDRALYMLANAELGLDESVMKINTKGWKFE